VTLNVGRLGVFKMVKKLTKKWMSWKVQTRVVMTVMVMWQGFHRARSEKRICQLVKQATMQNIWMLKNSHRSFCNYG
jgi:hypothetical protein